MRSATKKTAAADPGQHAQRGAARAHGTGDAQSRQLARLQKRVGNTEAGTSVTGAAHTRDQLLAFVCQRLQAMKGIQDKEFGQLLQERDWYQQVAKGIPGYTAPDPSRWHEAARDFKEAAGSLANGNLARGVQLLDRAMAHEEAARAQLPTMVRDDLEAEERASTAPPTSLAPASAMPLAPACDTPAGLVAADQILSRSTPIEHLEPIHAWYSHHWWDEEEEEEEDDEAAKKKKGEKAGGKAAEPPAPVERGAEPAEEKAPPQQDQPAPAKARSTGEGRAGGD